MSQHKDASDVPLALVPAGTEDIPTLVQRLADAEAALSNMLSGAVDAVHHPAGWTYLLRDAQQALLQSEAEAKEHAAVLRAILASAPDLLLEVDANGIIRFANTALVETAGAHIVGSHWLTLMPPERHAVMQRELAAVLETGEQGSFETVVERHDGQTLWYSNCISPVVRDGARVGAVMVSRDVTASKQAKAQLIVADRVASIGMIAAGVAHEINNPLASVIANLDLALRELPAAADAAAEETRVTLRDAREGAERIRQIVRDIRVFSRPEEERHGPIDVKQVLESMLRMAWNEIRHRARLVRSYDTVPPVLGTEPRLAQVFLNLIVNAAQAIPEGHALENQIRVATSLHASGRVLVEISDTGSGIAPDVQSRLFTPFFTTKPAGLGTGLGLTICQRIVNSLGGEIAVQSAVGHGSTFQVFLPQAPANSAPLESTPPKAMVPGRRGRVLVIDDDGLFTQAIQRSLAKHEVVATPSPLEALRLLENGARFDLVLCDLTLPEMSGLDLFARLEARFPAHAHRTVFMSAGELTPRAVEFFGRSPRRFVEKPIDLRQLLALVHEHTE